MNTNSSKTISEALPECSSSPDESVAAAAHADIEPALLFAGDIIDSYAESWGTDFDGADIQDMLERWGLVDKVEVTAENICADGCDCEVGSYCYRLNRHADAARIAYFKAARAKGE